MGGLPQPGDQFGRYRIVRRLGRGGMGVVYAAVQVGLDREVALKLLSPELSDSEEYRRRFSREAAALARLESPHVITVHDAGEHDGWLFIATQLVPDGDLGTWLNEHGPFPPDQALALLAQVAEGLGAAHDLGILHRDIKPSNVLLRRKLDGSLHAYLCDFGIALDEGSEYTKTTGVIGTLGYMAPERHRGDAATVASDIYSLGCLLWALVSASAPYTGTDWAVATAHMTEPIPTLAGPGEATAQVNETLRRSMAKLPGERPATVTDVAGLLSRGSAWAVGEPSTVVRDIPSQDLSEEHAVTVHRVVGDPLVPSAPSVPEPRSVADVLPNSTTKHRIRGFQIVAIVAAITVLAVGLATHGFGIKRSVGGEFTAPGDAFRFTYPAALKVDKHPGTFVLRASLGDSDGLDVKRVSSRALGGAEITRLVYRNQSATESIGGPETAEFEKSTGHHYAHYSVRSVEGGVARTKESYYFAAAGMTWKVECRSKSHRSEMATACGRMLETMHISDGSKS